jgi:hypothetical protein
MKTRDFAEHVRAEMKAQAEWAARWEALNEPETDDGLNIARGIVNALFILTVVAAVLFTALGR